MIWTGIQLAIGVVLGLAGLFVAFLIVVKIWSWLGDSISKINRNAHRKESGLGPIWIVVLVLAMFVLTLLDAPKDTAVSGIRSSLRAGTSQQVQATGTLWGTDNATGRRVVSHDGGKTWQDGGPGKSKLVWGTDNATGRRAWCPSMEARVGSGLRRRRE